MNVSLSGGYDDYYDAFHAGIGIYYDANLVMMDFGFGENQTVLGVDAFFYSGSFYDIDLLIGLGGGTSIWDSDAIAGANELYARGNIGLDLEFFILTYSLGYVFPNEFSPFEEDIMNQFGLVIVL